MFKFIFGLAGLLVVLAIVASLAKTQLGSIAQIGKPASPGLAAPGGAGSPGPAPPDGADAATPGAQQQIQGIQQSVRERTAEALQEGMQRNQRDLP